VAVVSHPARVMVELARQTIGALIVVEPESQPDLPELIRAVKTYYPKTVRWCYQSGSLSAGGQLCKLNGQFDPAAHPAQHKEPPANEIKPKSAEPEDGNPLGMVHRSGMRDRVRSLVVKVEAPDGLGEPLISEEELGMLLGPVPDEAEGDT